MPFGVFDKFVRTGELTIVDHRGQRQTFGQGQPRATWHLLKRSTLPRILRNPALNLGETYMAGEWAVSEGSLHDLLMLLRCNLEPVLVGSAQKTLRTLISSWNGLTSSRKNVSRHYDLDEPLFRACLDREMHYSCAYFRHEDMSLEAAQAAKCDHIARKLALRAGQRVLDIGCGWGSLALHFAEHFDVHVTGLTLSGEQLRVAQQRVIDRGMADHIELRLEDYRKHRGQYDRVVSVGMFEHVGKHNIQTFCDKVFESLSEDGVALLHTIGSKSPPSPLNPWFRRYVFPGGYIPSMSDIAPAIERSGFTNADVEILRYHYALTLQEWNRRFQQVRPKFVAAKGERFCRMWEFYLVASQTAFEIGIVAVQHWLLAKQNQTVPITRDYLYPAKPFAKPLSAPLHEIAQRAK